MRRFETSGLAHLLAVAGLHIGIVMGFALAVSRFGFALSERASLFWPTKKLSAICALAAGGAYMVLTGMHRADHPQLRHGLPVHRRADGEPPAVLAARTGAGGGGADADLAAAGAGRFLPDELLRGPGADRRV